jgi:hypothetical protein
MSKLDQLRAQREAWFSELRREIIKNPVNEDQKTRMMIQQAYADTVNKPKSNKSNKSNSESNGFDKKAYQREYMRKRRATEGPKRGTKKP